jgi:hypothetical protein
MLRILQIDVDDVVYDEADAAEAITPGHLVQKNSAGKFIKNTLVTAPVDVIVATEDTLHGGDIDTPWALNSRVVAARLDAGDEFYGIVAPAAAAIAFDAPVTAAADGTLVIGTEANKIGRAVTPVDNSAGATIARIRVRVSR